MTYQYHDESIITELPEDTVLYLEVILLDNTVVVQRALQVSTSEQLKV